MPSGSLRKRLMEGLQGAVSAKKVMKSAPKSENSEDADDKFFPILELPLEIRARIVEELDLQTRIALRRTCHGLSHAESIARFSLDELALYRTAENEFTLSVKHKKSKNWLLWQCDKGAIVTSWKDDDDFSRKHMDKEAKNTPFEREATPLGPLEPILLQYLRRSDIDMMKIDGFHCSDDSVPVLTALLVDKSIDYLSLVAPFSTTSDARFYELLHTCDTLNRLTLAIHRCPPKEKVVERECLLLATGLLERLSIHSRPLRHPRHSVDLTEVTDALLLKMLSGKCWCLQLLYFTPLLTPGGVHAAIQHVVDRNLPRAGFMIYVKAHYADQLLLLLGLKMDDGGTVTSSDKTHTIVQERGQLVVRLGERLRVGVVTPPLNLDHGYIKIVVETTQSSFDPKFFDNQI